MLLIKMIKTELKTLNSKIIYTKMNQKVKNIEKINKYQIF